MVTQCVEEEETLTNTHCWEEVNVPGHSQCLQAELTMVSQQ